MKIKAHICLTIGGCLATEMKCSRWMKLNTYTCMTFWFRPPFPFVLSVVFAMTAKFTLIHVHSWRIDGSRLIANMTLQKRLLATVSFRENQPEYSTHLPQAVPISTKCQYIARTDEWHLYVFDAYFANPYFHIELMSIEGPGCLPAWCWH